jgi:hypothetical protein
VACAETFLNRRLGYGTYSVSVRDTSHLEPAAMHLAKLLLASPFIELERMEQQARHEARTKETKDTTNGMTAQSPHAYLLYLRQNGPGLILAGVAFFITPCFWLGILLFAAGSVLVGADVWKYVVSLAGMLAAVDKDVGVGGVAVDEELHCGDWPSAAPHADLGLCPCSVAISKLPWGNDNLRLQDQNHIENADGVSALRSRLLPVSQGPRLSFQVRWLGASVISYVTTQASRPAR